MAAWDWDAYHAELLRRTRTVPPLMQSMRWNESANEADWLAPAQFPLPLYRLIRDEDGVPRRSLLSEHPCDPRDGNGMTAIALRQGIVEDIVRSSLIWSLVKQTPSERRRFFGMPITDIEHPHVGYVHWRSVPRKSRKTHSEAAMDLNALMLRSLKRLQAGSVNLIACDNEPAPHEEKAVPQTQEEREAAFPQLIVFDGIGHGLSIGDALRLLVSAVRAHSAEHGSCPSEVIILAGSTNLSVGYITTNLTGGNPNLVVYGDDPATKQELQTFFLGWERWRGAYGGPRELLNRAHRSLGLALASIEALGMRDPALAINPNIRKDEGGAFTNQATFDLTCTISAMQRDGRTVSTVAQVCEGLRERATKNQRHDLECYLWAALKTRGFDNARRYVSEALVDAAATKALPKPAALPFFSQPDIDEILQQEREYGQTYNSVQRTLAAYHCYLHLCQNPLLPSVFRTVFISNNNNEQLLQLMNEPLALGFLAQDACRHLIERTDGITEEMLGTYPGLMDPKAWAIFTEQLFSALDEANAPLLARRVLHTVYPHCVKFNQDITKAGIRNLREIGLRRFDGPSSTLRDRLKSALKTTKKVMQEGYADAVVRASLRHNLATGGTVPPAWAHWIGEPLLDDDFDGKLWSPNKKEIAERTAFLRELLNEPIPACDNAALLLTYAGKLQTRASLQL